jgi:hypothetical protein
MASNVTTFALYIPALALIGGSGLPLRQQGIAAVIILVITPMVAWVPLLLAVAVPGTSTPIDLVQQGVGFQPDPAGYRRQIQQWRAGRSGVALAPRGRRVDLQKANPTSIAQRQPCPHRSPSGQRPPARRLRRGGMGSGERDDTSRKYQKQDRERPPHAC